MREIVLGTAGHVDHGKTSLIRALTGIETDRLKEEKERGITIELGFAYFDLPCGHRLGIVDVPGHEKFIRNMVAGAAGVDLIAFIIAADEGIMPQTIEHFDICRLLGVKDGLIILTKKDMVEAEWLDMVQEDVQNFFADSFLAEAPIIPVSSVTGEGIEEVKAALDKKISAMSFHEEFGPFRLAVDRVFSMKGFGSVVTGTSLSGRTTVGSELTFYPGGLTAKIRGIQVHGKDVEVVEAGHRTAINLQGIEKEQINRGDMAATPGSLISSTLLDVDFHYLSSNSKELKNRTQVRVHVGTREIVGRIICLESDTIQPGNSANVQLLLQDPVSVWSGDHFVIRSYSPVATIGGGVILNNAPRKRKRANEKDQKQNGEDFYLLKNGTDEERLLFFLRESGFEGLTADRLATRLGVFGKRLKNLLQQPVSAGKIQIVESESQRMLSAEIIQTLTESIVALIAQYHKDNPLKTGLAKEELRSRLVARIDQKLFSYTLNNLIKKGTVIQDQAEIRLTAHTVTLQVDEKEMQEKIITCYAQDGLQPKNLKDVIARFPDFPEKQIKSVLNLLLQEEKLVKVTETLYFDAGVISKLQEQLIDFIKKEGEIDAPRFKDLTGLTRKFSIPLLEYFDRIKLTIRIEDRRVLR